MRRESFPIADCTCARVQLNFTPPMLSLSDGGGKQPLLCHFASLALGEKSSDLVALAHTQMAHHISSGSQHPGFISAGSQSARQVSAKCAHNLHTSASLLLFVRVPWNTLHYGPTYAILRCQGRPGWQKKLHYAGQNCNFMQIIMFYYVTFFFFNTKSMGLTSF